MSASTKRAGLAPQAAHSVDGRTRILSADASAMSALVLVSGALSLNFGMFDELGLFLLVIALPLAAASVRAPARHASPAVLAALVAAAGTRAAYHGFLFPVAASAPQARVDALEHPLVLLVAVISGAAVLLSRRYITVAWVLVVVAGILAAAAAALLWKWGVSDMDVLPSVQSAAVSLLHGHNPYLSATQTFVRARAAPAITVFPYLPAVAVLAALGAFFGDARLTSAALFLLLFPAIVSLVPGSDRARRVEVAAACVGFPLTVGMVLSAWVDIYAMAPFALWVALRHRSRTLAVISLSICFATKPTFALALIPMFLWSAKVRSEVAIAILGTLLIFAPFVALTGVWTFLRAVIGYHLFNVATRPDALTLNALAIHVGRHQLPGWAGLVAVLIGILVVAAQRPRDYGDAFGAGAALSILGFLMAKEAFFNYYFVAAVLLLMAVAGRGLPMDAAEFIHLPWPSAGIPQRLRLAGRW